MRLTWAYKLRAQLIALKPHILNSGVVLTGKNGKALWEPGAIGVSVGAVQDIITYTCQPVKVKSVD